MRLARGGVARALVAAALVAFLAAPQRFAPLFRPLTENGAPPIYVQTPLAELALAHLATVLVSTAASAVVAIGLAIFVTRPAGREFLPLSRVIVNVGQTIPPVAVLAIVVPMVGFGQAPTLIALFLYGLLPIFENALAGLASVPEATREAADGVGMTAWRKLVDVELPLAAPLILAGVKVSAIINLGTATLGSTVAASGLGEVIIAGLLSNNLAFVMQGALVVGAMATLVFDGLAALERRLARRTGLATGRSTEMAGDERRQS